MTRQKTNVLTLVCLLWICPIVGWADDREATPAVVNPALRSPLRQTLSLDGDWDFTADPSSVGEQEKWFSPETALPNKITLKVPGCWEAQGVGGPGKSTTVTPEQSIRPLRGSFVGTGWYRKELDIPKDWAGKEVWLKIGGVHAQGWFWVNGTQVGHNAYYCGTYKYNITDLVKSGEKAVVAAQVRNDVPSRKGLMGWIHRFGGLYRSVELDATPSLLIDDAHVVGDLDRRKAVVHVKARTVKPPLNKSRTRRGEGGEGGVGKAELLVTVTALDGSKAGQAGENIQLGDNHTADVAIPVSLDPFRPWSPEEPNLYRADIVLKIDGKAVDGWVERFGVRKWEVRGGNFYFNNQKHFIRGFGDDYIYPLTLCSPASRDIHKQHLQLAKSYGFAYVRHHTHCEVPEFFDAADEVGIMIQPELPYYANTPSAAAPDHFKPKEDLEELYTHYRRHVSLSTYCTGNEGHMGSPIDREVYQLAKQLDPTRLLLHQDGGINRRDNSDFHQGPAMPWTPGTQDASWPFDAHEYLNLATEEDPRLAEKYTGAVRPPVEPEEFRAKLAKAGLTWEWGVATLDAGNQLQKIYQKRGLEQARLDPICDGYIYWTLIDVGSPSAQGLFNQFWEPKASTAEFFRQFNSPVAILAKFTPPERILTAADKLDIEWWISVFGDPTKGEPQNNPPLNKGGQGGVGQRKITWHLQDGDRTLTSGELSAIEAEAGDVKSIGHSDLTAPTVTKPVKLKLTVELSDPSAPPLAKGGQGGVKNSWDLWVFPPRVAPPDGKGISASPRVYAALKNRYPGLTESDTQHSDLLLTDRLDRNVTESLEEGKTVVLLQLPGISPGVQMGWWGLSQQAGTAILQHPAFGDFPHDGYLNELLFRIIGQAIVMNDPALTQIEPLMVGRGLDGYMTYVFQAKSGKGKLFASGLQLFSEHPEAVYLLDRFIRYVRSPEFQPQGTFDPKNPGVASKELMTLHENLNGWTRTLQTSERRQYLSFIGTYPMCLARQTDGQSQVAWETAPAPESLAPDQVYAFQWVAGMGYVNEPSGKFTLFLDEQPLLDLDVVHKDETWRSSDGKIVLKYAVKKVDNQDSSGIMELTLPGSLLKKGERTKLRVVGSPKESQRWFGIYEIE